MAVTIHIEELVLHGFDPRDRHAVAGALSAQLATLFADRAPAQDEQIDRLDAGSIAIPDVRSPRAGGEVAGAVHREVTR